ncbi:hypothetical protein NQZ68_035172 [Dissostichus eleginoides]|nr:hypothetical protein NQZ68_035172 [Dissostichus eleginoides]
MGVHVVISGVEQPLFGYLTSTFRLLLSDRHLHDHQGAHHPYVGQGEKLDRGKRWGCVAPPGKRGYNGRRSAIQDRAAAEVTALQLDLWARGLGEDEIQPSKFRPSHGLQDTLNCLRFTRGGHWRRGVT